MRSIESGITASRVLPRDLLREAFAGLLQRLGRSVLTMLGTLLGVGAFVAVLGLTSTAGGQINQHFNALAATTVTVDDVGDGNAADSRLSFPADARDRIKALRGVSDAGVQFVPPLRNPTISSIPPLARDTSAAAGNGLGVIAVDPGIFAVTHAVLESGRTWDDFAQRRAEFVAVLGFAAARQLGVARLQAQPVVFINDTAYTVVGIVASVQRLPALAADVMIPTTTALGQYGPPVQPRARMTIETKIGAAQLIASQAARALRPDAPANLSVSAPADPTSLRRTVVADVNGLFLLLAGISLVIGAVGIANVTLVSVLERTGEIGLRRALGARPRHIGIQFLTESAILGTLGGLIGTALGIATVVSTAFIRNWTPVLAPWTVFGAPLLGTVIGILAGLYPSLRASRIEPADALRR